MAYYGPIKAITSLETVANGLQLKNDCQMFEISEDKADGSNLRTKSLLRPVCIHDVGSYVPWRQPLHVILQYCP